MPDPVSPEVPIASSSLAADPVATPAGSLKPFRGFLFDWIAGIALMLVLMLGCGFVWGLVRALQVRAEQGVIADAHGLMQAIGAPGPLALLLMSLFSMGPAALLIYVWRRKASHAERAASWQAAQTQSTWRLSALTGVLAFAVSTAAMPLARLLGVEADPSNDAMIRSAFASMPWLLGLFVVVLAPAYEELFFRRVLFARLWTAGYPAWGMLLSSLAFALAHEIPGVGNNSLVATVFLWLLYAGMGAAFAWLYLRTRTLWAPVAAHALNNALALLLMAVTGG